MMKLKHQKLCKKQKRLRLTCWHFYETWGKIQIWQETTSLILRRLLNNLFKYLFLKFFKLVISSIHLFVFFYFLLKFFFTLLDLLQSFQLVTKNLRDIYRVILLRKVPIFLHYSVLVLNFIQLVFHVKLCNFVIALG